MFISPKIIYADLARVYKNMSFNYSDIVEWCMIVETEYICDVDIMWRYEYRVIVKKGRITLPNNVYRIMSVKTDRGIDITYPAISSIYIHGLNKYNNKMLKVYFLGVPVDETCSPLIAASHREICKHYCIMNIIRPEALYDVNKFRMLQAMESQFSGMITSVKQGFREWTEGDIQRLSLHSYNNVFKEVYLRHNEYIDNGFPIVNGVIIDENLTPLGRDNIDKIEESCYDGDIIKEVLDEEIEKITVIS